MLEAYFESPRTRERLRSSLFGPRLDEFAKWLHETGYAPSPGRRFTRGANRFASWAQSKKLAIGDLDEVALDSFRRHLAAHDLLRYPNGSYSNAFRGARHFVTFLRAAGVLTAVAPIPSTPSQPLLWLDFCRWMKTQRGVRESTLRLYKPVVLDLVKSLGEESNFTASEVRDFVLDRARRSGIASAKTIVTSVRMFLRFLVVVGKCEPGVEYAVPTIAEWRLSRLPRYLQPEEVERAIDACDRSTATGARDRAVVLLMARLGLRAGDVAALKLCDVKWEEATLVVSGKNRREARLPLPKDVGDAIKFYLENYRPRVESKEVFISRKAPLCSISYSTISRTARRTLERAGIDAPSYGAHVFRHSAATGLLRQGASLQTIGTLLRHDSIETTAHYAKVDVDLLKQVTMPWPGVKTC